MYNLKHMAISFSFKKFTLILISKNTKISSDTIPVLLPFKPCARTAKGMAYPAVAATNCLLNTSHYFQSQSRERCRHVDSFGSDLAHSCAPHCRG